LLPAGSLGHDFQKISQVEVGLLVAFPLGWTGPACTLPSIMRVKWTPRKENLDSEPGKGLDEIAFFWLEFVFSRNGTILA